MAKKLPGTFRKKYDEDKFRKKILSKTFSEQDNAYLLSFFEKDDNGFYYIRREVGKEDIKRLGKIEKTIKGNTGVVLKGRLIVVAVLVAGVVLFNLLFKDMLIESALESGLSAVFGAKAEVNGLEFDVLGARLSVNSLAVANRDNPMANLFELGRTEIDFRMGELLKNKFVVENIACESIAWGTARKTSGAFAKPQAGGAKETGSDGSPEPAKPPLFSLSGLDPGKILESQANMLKSPAELAKSSETLRSLIAKWKGKPEELDARVKETDTSVNAALAIKTQAIRTADDVKNAYAIIDKALASVASSAKEVSGALADIGTDAKAAEDAREKAVAALAADNEYLSAFIQAPGGGAGDLVASQARYILASNLGGLYGYVKIGLDALSNVRIKDTAKKKNPEIAIRTGENIDFPGNGYPRFLVENASVSVGKPGDATGISVLIRDLSSSPDAWPHPIRLEYEQAIAGTGIIVKSSFDPGASSGGKAVVSVECDRVPVAAPELPEAFGVRNLSFAADVRIGYETGGGKGVSGELSVGISNIRGERTGKGDEVGMLLSGIILDAGAVSVKGTFSVDENGAYVFDVGTSLDDLVVKKVGKIVNDSIARARDAIAKELDAYLGQSLAENAALLGDMKKTERSISGKNGDLAASNTRLANKKSEIEARAKALLGNEAQKVLGDLLKF